MWRNKKTRMKISHEVPFCLLEKSREFNDYDYCLPHLLDQNEEYRNFFYESKKMGRYIIMDNSLHELGEAYDSDRLIYWINELKPDEFIVPDVWEDYESSVENAIKWKGIELPKETTKVVVVQAKNAHEARSCYDDYLGLGYIKIAFSYGASWYNDICPHPNKDLGKAIGRFTFIQQLNENSQIPYNLRIHLLGTASPIEFGMYKNIPQIESIDTSNPIMAAIGEMPYHKMGLTSKPKANMNDYQYISIDKIDLGLVEYNIKQFKQINNMENNEYLSLYDYLGKAAGSELGKTVKAMAVSEGVATKSKQVSNLKYKGEILMYPREFLNKYFEPPMPTHTENPTDDLPFPKDYKIDSDGFEDDLPF